MTGSDGQADLATLLAAAAGGDQAAFAEVYDATAPRVFGLVLRVLQDRAQAEEVTQEVFLQVWRRAGSFDAGRGTALSRVLTLAHRRGPDVEFTGGILWTLSLLWPVWGRKRQALHDKVVSASVVAGYPWAKIGQDIFRP